MTIKNQLYVPENSEKTRGKLNINAFVRLRVHVLVI